MELGDYSHSDASSIVRVAIIDRHRGPLPPLETVVALHRGLVAHREVIEDESDAVVVRHPDGPRAVGVTGEGARMAGTRDAAC